MKIVCFIFSYYLFCKLNHLFWCSIPIILFNSSLASASRKYLDDKSRTSIDMVGIRLCSLFFCLAIFKFCWIHQKSPKYSSIWLFLAQQLMSFKNISEQEATHAWKVTKNNLPWLFWPLAFYVFDIFMTSKLWARLNWLFFCPIALKPGTYFKEA